jgi:hypothetical protein
MFTTATTYLFRVAYGGSALPKESGPAIGLAMTHHDVSTMNFDSTKKYKRGHVRKFDHLERIDMLKTAAYSAKDIAEFCVEAIEIRKSRSATVEEVQRKRKRANERVCCSKRRMFNSDSSSDDEYDA